MGDRTPANFVSFETFEHDQDGNMTKRTLASSSEEVSYGWTDFESRRRYEVRLKHVESDTNGRMQDARYDVDGLRSRKFDKNGNSSVEYGVGISTSASKPGSGTSAAPSISYVSGHMILGAEIDGTFVYHLGDALSSVRDVVDSSGNVIRSNEWDEYGNLISSSGSGQASPKTWVGGLSVNDDTADSKLYNMGHRNYAGGVLGRFISRDPIGFAGGLNLYAYPTSPVNFVDPAGLEPAPIIFHVKSAEIQAMNQALGTSFSMDAFVNIWRIRLHRAGIDGLKIQVKEGFYPGCADRSQRFVADDEGYHINLHYTEKQLLSYPVTGRSEASRSRVSYTAVKYYSDKYFPGYSGAALVRRLNTALYNISMHEVTHGIIGGGDYSVTRDADGNAIDWPLKGCIMAPTIKDEGFYNGLIDYGPDSGHINLIKQRLWKEFGR